MNKCHPPAKNVIAVKAQGRNFARHLLSAMRYRKSQDRILEVDCIYPPGSLLYAGWHMGVWSIIERRNKRAKKPFPEIQWLKCPPDQLDDGDFNMRIPSLGSDAVTGACGGKDRSFHILRYRDKCVIRSWKKWNPGESKRITGEDDAAMIDDESVPHLIHLLQWYQQRFVGNEVKP